MLSSGFATRSSCWGLSARPPRPHLPRPVHSATRGTQLRLLVARKSRMPHFLAPLFAESSAASAHMFCELVREGCTRSPWIHPISLTRVDAADLYRRACAGKLKVMHCDVARSPYLLRALSASTKGGPVRSLISIRLTSSTVLATCLPHASLLHRLLR